MQKTSDAEEFSDALTELAQHHPREALFWLRVHEAVLRRDVRRAVELSLEWANEDLLSPTAAAVAVHFLGDLSGRYEEAAQYGLEALRRIPGDRPLSNNVAYVLALLGRTSEARRILRHVGHVDSVVAVRATEGLIALLEGHISDGMNAYAEAAEWAITNDDGRLRYLVQANLALGLMRVSDAQLQRYGVARPEVLEIPADLADDVSIWMLTERAAREGLPVQLNEPDVQSTT
jgi:tetratricopeptide (TPR) repeat protein